MKNWLTLPDFIDLEVTRQARVLYRLLRAMTLLVLLGVAGGLLDPKNDVTVTLLVYAVILCWLAIVAAVVRRGQITLAAWTFGLFFWALIAFITLSFGGLQGQNASVFAVCTLLVGSVIGGRAAMGMAFASSAWCAFVAYLESNDLLPWQLGPYTPINAWTAVTVTVSLTSVLLHESLTSLSQMHAEAQTAAAERDEALRRSINGQKMELVGNLTSGIAHDLNNLLTVMVGAVELLRSEPALQEESTLSLLDSLDQATSRSALMTSQLLAFGRTQANEGQATDLGAVLSASGQMLPRLLGPLIEVRTSAEADAWIFASRPALEQIVLNLAVNARDAMPGGGIFELAAKQQEDRIVLSARDTGVGINADVQSRVFEPFFTTKATGTGLGLATVMQLTTHYEGRIELESQPGQGTTFRLSFPRLPPPAGRAADSERKSALGTWSAERPSRGRILVVEDDVLVRQTLIRILSRDGYDVTAVADGEEALAVVKTTEELACVVTDISMRRMAGDVLASQLSTSHPRLPVVIISGNRTPAPAADTGAPRQFLPKPVSANALSQAIQSVTQKPRG
ncbi:MAG TPA: ATP-binding protein [Polyangiaceae bacterium]|nr:ATP-binding protein [Polyangiaceae bacterium]